MNFLLLTISHMGKHIPHETSLPRDVWEMINFIATLLYSSILIHCFVLEFD